MTGVFCKRLSLLFILLTFSLVVGCAGMDFAPKKSIWFYPEELPQAAKAVCDAQKAGKDKKCPSQFNTVKQMKDDAYEVFWACNTAGAIEMAKRASGHAKKLCKEKVIDRMTLTINFDFDKSTIRQSDKEQLQTAIAMIKKYPGSRVRIEGHTDWTGTNEYNQSLSVRRSIATKKYIVSSGSLNARKISAVGHGESKPVATNRTREGRFKNRRVEILILAD